MSEFTEYSKNLDLDSVVLYADTQRAICLTKLHNYAVKQAERGTLIDIFGLALGPCNSGLPAQNKLNNLPTFIHLKIGFLLKYISPI